MASKPKVEAWAMVVDGEMCCVDCDRNAAERDHKWAGSDKAIAVRLVPEDPDDGTPRRSDSAKEMSVLADAVSRSLSQKRKRK